MRPALVLLFAFTALTANSFADTYELVITNGRVMNPANGLDSIRHIGIRDGAIAALSRDPIEGEEVVDASGLVVAPGFIDLHAHGQREFEAILQAQDGVTTQLEMELGAYPVDSWYEKRAGKVPINYGATVGHIGTRIAAMLDKRALGIEGQNLELHSEALAVASQHREWMDDPATEAQIADIKARIQEGLDQGALGMGFGVNYTAGATREEVLELFRLAEANGVTNFVHSRFMTEYNNGGSVDAIQELIADVAITGASLHIVHIGSSGGNRVRTVLEMIDGARAQGLDITTEVYPYTAWSTFVGASIFNGEWTKAQDMQFEDIELPSTGERLNAQRFRELRESAPDTIIVGHGMKEDNVSRAVAHPGVMIASDGMIYDENGRAHPRGAGTFSRVLGHYVREKGVVSLMDAIGKMSYLPARRLEAYVPQ
ncbi:MAG: amidohydrolase family protein, partial [Xanthomonadales bacterium]|nr:amidohydrolase family protein [Xanthomonadales bacterium]